MFVCLFVCLFFVLFCFGFFFFFLFFALFFVFFNPAIEVVTFRLRGWCMLCVFLLPAFNHLRHGRQDLLKHVCTDFISVYTSFWRMELTMLSLESQPVSQSASQPASQSASQPASQSASQPVSQSASQPASQSASQPVSQPASQPVSQSARQPASQPISQSASHSNNKQPLCCCKIDRYLATTQRQVHRLVVSVCLVTASLAWR